MNVVALRQTSSLPAMPVPDERTRYRIAHAISFADDPTVHLPDDIDDLVVFLPHMIEEAEEWLVPAGPAEVLRCLQAFAAERNLAMPTDDLALDLSVEILGEIPRDLFRLAIRTAWTAWPSHFRRLPDAAALMGYIRPELEARREKVNSLRMLGRKLDYREKLRRDTEAMRASYRQAECRRGVRQAWARQDGAA
jgi:hypothetical protein